MRRRRRIWSTGAALLAGAALSACAGGAGAPADGSAAAADRFDARRAFADLRAQVALGPRPAGSAASRRLAERLRQRLPGGRFEPVPGGLRNVVGTLPGRGRPILVGAHYDTKDIPRFVGANDGASGTATVLELARALAPGRRACDREVRFVMFDGEESPAGSPDSAFVRDGLRGSKAYAAAHADELAAVVVVDFVGDRDLSIPREAGSDAGLWRALRDAARRVGAGEVFPSTVRGRIFDDHLPFTQRGVPAIDLIDFDYPHFHRPSDTLDKVSARSLDRVGETLVEMLQRMARQTCQPR
jgi:glutaminyl-peptide cyclotransferase